MYKGKIIIVLMIVMSTIIGCGNNIADKAIEKAKTAMENQNYEQALASLEIALDEDSDNAEAKQLYSIINDYKIANSLMEKGNFEEIEMILTGIDSEYVSYGIKEDIDALKLQVKEKKEASELINSKLAQLETLISEKSYDGAKGLIEDIRTNSLNEEQENKVNELSARIDSELAEIEAQRVAEEAKKLAEEEAKQAAKQAEEKNSKSSSSTITEEEAIKIIEDNYVDLDSETAMLLREIDARDAPVAGAPSARRPLRSPAPSARVPDPMNIL